LEAYTFVSHILELVIHTIDDQNDHPKMFDFLRRLLRLYQEDYDPELLSFIFELKLLYFLGYGLRFTGCSLCQENNHLVYHIGSGGLVCKSHLDAFTDSYEEDVYTLIKDLYYTDINDLKFPQIDKNKRIIIRHILDVTYADFVSYQSKSRQILKQIKKY
jgi:DNA repair protein RecO (recombination protein O)